MDDSTDDLLTVADAEPEILINQEADPGLEIDDLTEEIADLSEISEIETISGVSDLDLYPDEDIQKIDEQIDVLKADLTESAESELPSELFYGPTSEWEPDFEQLSKNIDTIPTGIDLPSGIFSLAVKSFELTSGIFMTFESDSGYFAPFSSLSIDETSLRRCRIHIDILKDNNLIFAGSNINTSVPKSFLKDYLSKRLWDVLEHIDLLVFNHHDSIFGILLMFNLNVSKHSQFVDFASFFTRKCSELFYNSRSKIIRTLPDYSDSAPVDAEKLPDILLDNIGKAYKKDAENFKLVFIDYSDIIENIRQHDAMLDIFRIESDIFRMYSSMLLGLSFIYRIFGGRIILSLSSGMNNDKSLVRHQMSASLQSLFEKDHLIKPPTVYVEDFDPEDPDLSAKIGDFLSDKL